MVKIFNNIDLGENKPTPRFWAGLVVIINV